MVLLLIPAVLVLAVVVGGVCMLPVSFLTMLILGSLHSDLAVVPAWGFWTVFKVLWLVSIAGGCWKGVDYKADKSKS